MQDSLIEQKAMLRHKAMALRSALTVEQRERSDALLHRYIQNSGAYRAAEIIFTYLSVGNEPDTRRLIETARHDGKKVALPRCIGRGVMEARIVDNLSELRESLYGILQPSEDAPLVSPDKPELILVPGLFFDSSGVRLGRGGGYYDRYLPLTTGLRFGMCGTGMMYDRLPYGLYDVHMDAVVTEEGIIHCGN